MKPFINSIILIFALSSCATIYTGNKALIHFSSDPQNAEVSINNKPIGTTPITTNVKRSIRKQTVTIKKEGYEPQNFTLTKKIKYISLVNFFFTPIDFITGGIVDYTDNFIHTDLKRTTADSVFQPITDLTNYFYVITPTDTFLTNPFQKMDYENFYCINIDNINFKLLNGDEKSIPIENVMKYKTMEIYKKGIGYLLLYCHVKTEYIIKTFIPVKYSETKRKTTYVMMEDLLNNKEYHLERALVQVTSMNGNGGVSSTMVPEFYLYKEDEVASKIKQKELLQVVEQYFPDYTDLISALKHKNKFKTLEKYIYKEHRGADTHNLLY